MIEKQFICTALSLPVTVLPLQHSSLQVLQEFSIAMYNIIIGTRSVVNKFFLCFSCGLTRTNTD